MQHVTTSDRLPALDERSLHVARDSVTAAWREAIGVAWRARIAARRTDTAALHAHARDRTGEASERAHGPDREHRVDRHDRNPEQSAQWTDPSRAAGRAIPLIKAEERHSADEYRNDLEQGDQVQTPTRLTLTAFDEAVPFGIGDGPAASRFFRGHWVTIPPRRKGGKRNRASRVVNARGSKVSGD